MDTETHHIRSFRDGNTRYRLEGSVLVVSNLIFVTDDEEEMGE